MNRNLKKRQHSATENTSNCKRARIELETLAEIQAFDYERAGRRYFKLKEYETSLVSYNKSLDILSTRTSSTEDCARLLHSIGLAYYAMKQYDAALRNFHMSLEMYQRVYNANDDNEIVCNILQNIGNAFNHLEIHVKALEYHKKSLEMRQRIQVSRIQSNDPTVTSSILAYSISKLGECYYNLKDYKNAVVMHSKALEIRQNNNNIDNNDTANSFHNLASSYFRLNDYKKSVDFNLNALEMRKRLNNVDAIIASNNRLGVVYSRLGDYEKALFHFKDALEVKEKTCNNKDNIELAKCLDYVSKAYYNLKINKFAALFKLKAAEMRERLASNSN
jgi:tetratricopeptide (TPR) repeat protein